MHVRNLSNQQTEAKLSYAVLNLMTQRESRFSKGSGKASGRR